MPVLTKINTNVIADDAVTAAKIPADALGATDIAANAIGTSEIATGGVLPANIAYLGDGTGNLSGTITNQQLHFGSAFTLTDDLTVNGDVTLGKVRDDGTGQSITGDGKTLTGTGTLTMGSSIEGEPKNRTKERQSLPSTSASDLDSGTLAGARMAAGTVINTVSNSYATATTITSTAISTGTSTGLTCTITPTSTSNKILVTVDLYFRGDGGWTSFGTNVYDGTSRPISDSYVYSLYMNASTVDEDFRWRNSFTYWVTPPSQGSAVTYTVYAAKQSGSSSLVAQFGSEKSYMTLMEIKQ